MAIISSKSSPEPKPPKKGDSPFEAAAPNQSAPESLVRESKNTAENATPPATAVEDGLRPKKFADYIGQ